MKIISSKECLRSLKHYREDKFVYQFFSLQAKKLYFSMCKCVLREIGFDMIFKEQKEGWNLISRIVITEENAD